MEPERGTPSLAELLTVLYRPRQTMRRVLDRGPDRWAVPIVLLAFLCTSANDPDIRHLHDALPTLSVLSLVALVALVLVVVGASWVLTLYLLSWIATFVGRVLGGVAPVADVRAALAWGMVPALWSVIYRIPLVVFRNRIDIGPDVDARKVLLDFLAQGGCAIVVVVMALQLLFFLWSIFVASSCMGEAQRFSSWRGFANVAVSIALPLIVIAGLAFSLTR